MKILENVQAGAVQQVPKVPELTAQSCELIQYGCHYQHTFVSAAPVAQSPRGAQ